MYAHYSTKNLKQFTNYMSQKKTYIYTLVLDKKSHSTMQIKLRVFSKNNSDYKFTSFNIGFAYICNVFVVLK